MKINEACKHDNLTKKRQQTIDIARGIGIVLVVLGHAIAKTLEITPPQDFLKQSFNFIYSFHMPLLFFIGGVFINNSIKDGFKSFLQKKFKRLVIPYFSWVFITIAIKVLTASYQHNQRHWTDFFLSLIIPFEQYYFIYTMFFLGLLYLILGQKAFLCLSFLGYCFQRFIPDFWILHLLAKFAIHFAIGSYLLQFQHVKLKQNLIYMIVISAVMLVAYLLSKNVVQLSIIIIKIFAVLGVAYSISLKNSIIFDWCGKHSMQIYCMHPIFMGITRIAFNKITYLYYPYALTFTQLIFSIVMCYFVVKIWPLGNYLYIILFGEKRK